jgi:glycosyltransferase involved in cell wall biosynthesis
LKKILFVTHDTNRAGAQLFLLNIMKDFLASNYEISLLCLLKEGALLTEFESICEVKEIPKVNQSRLSSIFRRDHKKQLIRFIYSNYQNQGFELIYANTIAVSSLAPLLKEVLKIEMLTHIHELQFSLEQYSSEIERNELFKKSDKIIACSNSVRDNLVSLYPHLNTKTEVIHSFVENENVLSVFNNSSKTEIKKEFGLPNKKILVGACGNADWRKGVDVFINLINHLNLHYPGNEIHFVWIGLKSEGSFYEHVMYDIKKMQIGHLLTLIDPTPKAVEIINAVDIFCVSSREDPFPLVMLEAALCQKPILGFHNTGGCSEFVKNEAGILSAYLDIANMARNLLLLANSETIRNDKGKAGQQSVINQYSFNNSMLSLKKQI